MSSFDQDDILLEIKRKKSATAAAKPHTASAEEPKTSPGSETTVQQKTEPAVKTESSGQRQPMAERVSRSSAAVASSQDEEWDLLWQSVAVKQKKPVLFDYDAQERASAAAAQRKQEAEPEQQPVSDVPPAAVAVEEPEPKRRPSAANFEINIPDLDDEPKSRTARVEPEKPVVARRTVFPDTEDLLESSSADREQQEPETVSPVIDQEEQELTSRRKNKINDFFAHKNFDVEESVPEQPEPEPSEEIPAADMGAASRMKARRLREEEDEEPEAPLSPEEMREEIARTRTGILVRVGISLVCFILLFYLHLVKVHMLMAPEFLWPEYHPLTFIAVNFALLLITVLANSSIVGGGLISLLTFKPDTDSLTSLSAVASVVQGAVLTMMPKHVMDPATHLYLFIPALALLCCNIGRLMYINRVDRGSRIVSGNYDKYAIVKMEDLALARELTRGLDMEDPSVAVSIKADTLTGYEEAAYASDFSENLSRILAPICLIASIAVAVTGYFLSDDRNVFAALTSFAALTAVCSPLTASIAASMPLGRMSRKLHKEGAMIAGYEAADNLSDVSAVVLNATDLFTAKDITLFSVKPFAEKRIDEALLDAASLICATDSTLTGIFSNIIQGQKSLLRPVENITYEDGMGLAAWVNKKRVLIGNRTLMQHYGVDTPSKDFETKYCRDHRDILYLANSGELSAMFVLGYSANEEVQEMLDHLADQNIAIVVNTNDPNVTAEKICRLYDFPMEDIRIVPAQAREALTEYLAPRETAPAQAAHMGTASSLVSTVCASYSVRTAVVLATMIQFIGVILGYGVLAFFVFTGASAHLTPDLVAVYMAIWAVLVMVIPRLRKI